MPHSQEAIPTSVCPLLCLEDGPGPWWALGSELGDRDGGQQGWHHHGHLAPASDSFVFAVVG